MNTRALGASGPRVSALGLGAMGMSDQYGPTDEGESIATIHAAIDAGITLVDTGDFYGAGVSILGVIGPSATQSPIDNLSTVALGPAKDPACCTRVSDCGRRSSDSR